MVSKIEVFMLNMSAPPTKYPNKGLHFKELLLKKHANMFLHELLLTL